MILTVIQIALMMIACWCAYQSGILSARVKMSRSRLRAFDKWTNRAHTPEMGIEVISYSELVLAEEDAEFKRKKRSK